MTNKSMVIKGMNFPMEDKQDKHFSVHVTGKTFAVYHGMRKLPEEKAKLWEQKGYAVINNIAYAMMQENGNSWSTQFHKTLWYTAMNTPAGMIVYTTRLDDTQLGFIKFCLTHGIKVALEDLCSGIKTVLNPVANIHTVPLFKKFKVESFDPTPLSKSGQQLVYLKRRLLAEARQEYMRPIWESVNIELEEISNFYNELRMETAEEKRIKADRYRTQDVLLAANKNISFFVYNEFTDITGQSDLDKPEVIDGIIRELSIWAPAFDMNLKLSDIMPESGTFQPRKWLKNTTERAYFKQALKIRKSLKPDDLHKIIEAYIQIQYYKEQLDIHYNPSCEDYSGHYSYDISKEDLLSDRYYICEGCGHPTNKTADNCPYCELTNYEKEPEWESYNTTNEYTEVEEM